MITRKGNETIEYKRERAKKYLNKLMHIAKTSASREEYNLALSALSAYCDIQYTINQVYTDEEAEGLLLSISEKVVKLENDYQGEKNTVIFYDGFGFDLRGWAISYIKALASLNYKLIYITTEQSKGKIPHIEEEIRKCKGDIAYINMQSSYTTWIRELNSLFVKYKPSTAFFYTTPNDVSGTAVFSRYKGLIHRIQVDLTDHAFWIGVNAFDIATECRIPGASNLIYERGVSKGCIVRIDPTPYICRDVTGEAFPFDIENEDYIFSGGALYKTLGDPDLLFYQIVDRLLGSHKSIKFLYVGEGNDCELKKLIDKYPDRVFHLHERKDFYCLFEHCLFYLNTYPMFGGLMMRYAALAGKVPLTLAHNDDQDGILYEQEKRGLVFDKIDDLILEANRLILEESYQKKRKRDMEGACLNEEDFARNVKLIIEEGRTENCFTEIPQIDTQVFRNEYLARLNIHNMIISSIPNKRNAPLAKFYPILFVEKAWRKIYDKF